MMASGSSSATRCRRTALAVAVGVGLACVGVGCVREVSGPPRGWKDQEAAKFSELPPEEFIYLGMDSARLKRLMGEPKHVEKPDPEGSREVWRYDSGIIVILENGSVVFKHPPSRAAAR